MKYVKPRKLKKRNRKYIKSILNMIPFKIKAQLFGSGYFIFSFRESSVLHFKLKEFPDWKFGIWLNDYDYRQYEIFGQCISMIDKFKPSRSPLCEDNIQSFNDELYKIYVKDDSWLEYLRDAAEETEMLNKYDIQNRVYYKAFFDFITNWNKKQEEKEDTDFKRLYLKLQDNGSNCSPRYNINVKSFEEFQTKEFEFEYFAMEFVLYVKICEYIDAIYDPNKLTGFYANNFIFNGTIREEILGEQEWTQRSIDYKWDEQDYSKFLENKYNYYKPYEISDRKLKIQLYSWFVTNYCDSQTQHCFIDTYEKLYSGKYNVQYAKEVINEMFRNPERVQLKLNKLKEGM